MLSVALNFLSLCSSEAVPCPAHISECGKGAFLHLACCASPSSSAKSGYNSTSLTGLLPGLNERIHLKSLEQPHCLVIHQKLLLLLWFNNIHGILTLLQPWVRRWGAAESQTDGVSTFRKLSTYCMIPEVNVKWHHRSILKERAPGCSLRDLERGSNLVVWR